MEQFSQKIIDSYPNVKMIDSSTKITDFVQEGDEIFLTDITMVPNFYTASISNLIRLGFIEVSFSETLSDKKAYKIYENNIALKTTNSLVTNSIPENKSIELEKGIIFITKLGLDFISICI